MTATITDYDVRSCVFDALINVTADTDSVREGWYNANCGECDWHTSGAEPVVEEAAYEHIATQHALHLTVARFGIEVGQRLAEIAHQQQTPEDDPVRTAARRVVQLTNHGGGVLAVGAAIRDLRHALDGDQS